MMVWYLNSYFTLDDAQEDQLRDAVQRNFEWHRRTQLPKYAEFARQLEQDAESGLTVEILEARGVVVHRVEEAIEQAVAGELSVFEDLNRVLANPFEAQPDFDAYAQPPEPHERVTRTFCGT